MRLRLRAATASNAADPQQCADAMERGECVRRPGSFLPRPSIQRGLPAGGIGNRQTLAGV